jgi:gluconate 2-dehydrogenase gamma chain
MKRRDVLKNIALTSVGVAAATTGVNADPALTGDELLAKKKKKTPLAGRTQEEADRNAKLLSETFFTLAEMATITILCDIILPADATSGSASQAGVPAFIEFIAKDMPHHQTPLRGGLMWLENQSRKRFGAGFAAISPAQRLQIVEDIAYPEKAVPAMKQGTAFFNLMRDLTMTGFYTSEVGFKDLGYMGNQPNVWQGVPEEVLKQFGF